MEGAPVGARYQQCESDKGQATSSASLIMATKKNVPQIMTEGEIEAEAERNRELRKKQYVIHDKLHSQRDDIITKTGEFDAIRYENNELFQGVNRTREQLNDTITMCMLSNIMKKRASVMDNLSRILNFDSFVTGLQGKYLDESGHFSWDLLGGDIGSLASPTPPVLTLLGPLKRQEKVRAKNTMAKKKEEKLVAVRADEVTQGGKGNNDDVDEATNARFIALARYAEAKSAPGPDGNIKTFNIESLIDPVDPVQTVENLFDFSFLVKEKKVLVSVNDDNVPYATFARQETKAGSKQMVLTLKMKDLKKLNAQLKSDGVQCELHRIDDLYAARNAHEQADILDKRAEVKTRLAGKKKSASSSSQADDIESSSPKKRKNNS